MKADTNVKKETTIIVVWRVIKLLMLIEIKLALLLSISIDFITIKAEVKIDINISELPKKLSIIP